ncbi:MAG: HI0074 family nucleotidyltransferase substrate-binding subunit [Clostridium sp.]
MKKLDNFTSHLNVMNRAHLEDLNNEFIVSGIIDKFFIQFELGWKVLKELLKYEGRQEGTSGSPREIIKASFQCYDFIDESTWLSMLKDRNDCTHIYNEDMAKALVKKIIEVYIPAFNLMSNNINL